MFSNSKSGKFALSLPPVAFDFVSVFTALINKSFGMVYSCECNHAFLDYNTLSNNLRLWLFLAQSTSECLQKRSFVSFLNCHQKTFSVIFLDSTVTHCPSTLCPNDISASQICFRRSALSFLLHQVFDCCERVISHTSRQKLSQSTLVLEASPSSCLVCAWSKFWHQQYVNLKISSNFILLFPNQLPFLLDISVLCLFPLSCLLHSLFRSSDQSSYVVKLISAPHIGHKCPLAISPSAINKWISNSLSSICFIRSSYRQF